MMQPAIALLIASALLAPDASLLAGARVHAAAQMDARGLFVYRYTIENGARSAAPISKLAIDVSLTAGAARARNSIGLSAPQPGWRAIVISDETARWEAIQDTGPIAPNRSLGGLSMTSDRPPALRRFTLTPQIDPQAAAVMSPGDDPGDVDRYNQDFARYVESKSVTGVTLAPTGLVALTPEAVLGDLTNQIIQARSLGWISDDPVTRKLKGRIEEARAAFSRRQSQTARNIVSSLRSELAARSGRNLTGEAHALVELNLEYVLQPEGKR
jgi:hypothetical protein